jgi:hypothetical protein
MLPGKNGQQGIMLLLHISDIHFREPDCVNPDLDPDHPCAPG